MGSHHLDGVFDIYPPSSVRTCGQQITVCVTHFFLFDVANVLVWSELSSGGTAKYTFI
jgi:hypothetical protein